MIKTRVRTGRLLPVRGHRAVFQVGHAARTPRTMLWAAHLALGPASVISHRSAAALWDLRAPGSHLVEMTVAGPTRRRAALRVHRTASLPQGDVVRVEGLPVTAVARTLLDLGAVVTARHVERAYDQAVVLRVLDHREVQRVLQEGARRPGARDLRRVIARHTAGTTLTTNDLDELMLAIVRRAGLPDPVCQYPVLGYVADFCWPSARLIAETDGGAAHGPTERMIHDARRDVRLQNAGWRVLRFPRWELIGDPAYVARALTVALS
jgi:very-short-patch-repair endonuclease